jgi:cell division transport system ATP-binding protein
MAIFQAFNQVGVTVIMSTHDALGMSADQNRVLHLDHGQLTEIPFIQKTLNLNITPETFAS